MEPSDHTHHAPVLAAFSPVTGAREPVEFGVAASRITGAPLVIVVVQDTGSLRVRYGADEVPESPASISEAIKHLEEDLRRRGVQAEARAFEDSTAARGLARAIDELEPELVVVGSTTRGKRGATLLGTTAERVIHAAACPVAIVPHGYARPEGGVRVVGAAYAPTPEGEDALRLAATLAHRGQVGLRVLTVIDPKYAQEEAHGLMAEHRHEVGEEAHIAAQVRLDREAQVRAVIAETGEIDAEISVMVDEPADALTAVTRHIDLLVMGSRGLGPHRAVVLGSVSRKVISGSSCPVVVIPRGADARRDELLADVESQS